MKSFVTTIFALLVVNAQAQAQAPTAEEHARGVIDPFVTAIEHLNGDSPEGWREFAECGENFPFLEGRIRVSCGAMGVSGARVAVRWYLGRKLVTVARMVVKVKVERYTKQEVAERYEVISRLWTEMESGIITRSGVPPRLPKVGEVKDRTMVVSPPKYEFRK